MFEIRPREIVILAEDFDRLVAWYRDVLGFDVVRLFEDQFHFCNLETSSGIRLGIGLASEMGVVPGDRQHNTVVFQIEVDDVRGLFEFLEENGATITGGPSFDEQMKFWFGSFADPEGNPVWVVDGDCP
jgi:predicted enzyme related to lactoylglutathione lyase